MAAIYDGVYANNFTRSGSSLRERCPTGNSIFLSYVSLAVCANCHNISSLLRNMRQTNSLGDIYTYILPNNHTLVSAQSSVTYLNISASRGLGTLPSTPLALNSDDLSFYQSPGAITNISIINGANPNLPWTQNAWDCVLSFCAKSYNASESFGVFDERILDTFDEIKQTIYNKTGFD